MVATLKASAVQQSGGCLLPCIEFGWIWTLWLGGTVGGGVSLFREGRTNFFPVVEG
jgi:hypothetical protein